MHLIGWFIEMNSAFILGWPTLIWKLAGIFNTSGKKSISCSVHSCFISRTWRFWANGTCLTISSLEVALNTSEPRSVLNICCAIWNVMLQWRSSFHYKEAHFYEWPKSTKSLKFKLIHRQNTDWNFNMHNPPPSVTGKFKISTHICYLQWTLHPDLYCHSNWDLYYNLKFQ